MKNQISSEKRRICANSALECHGTAYIFEKRAAKIRIKVIFLSFLGIAVPALVGTIIIDRHIISIKNIQIISYIAGILASIQLVLSIWSLVSGWVRNLSYYLESKVANYRISRQFDELNKTTTLPPYKFDIKFQSLKREIELRENLDNQFDITDKEKRMGMRYGLRKYQRACAGCNEIPKTMKATECGICGKF